MIRRSLFTVALPLTILLAGPAAASAQVFFGGFYPGPYYAGFYDPFWGPWGGYYSYYDPRPQLRIKVEPEDELDDAAVYIDGHLAGVVDDFDGHGAILEEGGHTVTVYQEGFKTAQFKVHVSEGKTFKIRHTMTRLAPGERSEPPDAMASRQTRSSSPYAERAK